MKPAPNARAAWLAQHIVPHERAIRSWLARRTHALDIDDIIQEMYARLAALENVDDIRNPRQYAAQTAISITLNLARHARVVPMIAVGDFEELGLTSLEPSPERAVNARDVPLRDGSVAYLNTNSEISVHYSAARRFIQLIQGESLFDVAKNKHRPFIVQAGATQVRAVGTSFNVKFLPGQPVQVLVREGVVEVKRPDVPVAPTVRLAMNSRAIAPSDAPIIARPVETVEVGRELAWRVGRIAFHGESLGEAVAEFARYSDIRILIDDPSVANQKVTGLFVSADPVGFSRAVATSFDLRVEISDRQIRLIR